MKTIFDNRFFCIGMSLACAWFMYEDLSDHSKINVLNLLYFVAFTFLAVYRKKPIAEKSSSEDNSSTIINNRKDIVYELHKDKELQLTKTFKK